MIFTENLCKRFENFLAVDGVSINVQPGQLLVLLGQNGAGKTTTVRMLSSVLKPSSGKATIAGFDVIQDAEKVRACVGVLTEQHGLYGRMNALEYLDFFGRLYSMKPTEIQLRSKQLLEEFGLGDALRKRLGEYSKGMRQKLALSRALLHNPAVLLLDEPTSALDPESAQVVREAIRGQRSSGRSIILCTHNLSEAEALADQVAIIRHGKIIYYGLTQAFIRELLGPVQYEACFSAAISNWEPVLPQGVIVTGSGPDWMHFQVDDPQRSNPLLLQQMLDNQLPIVTFQEVPRNLEQAYLEAVGSDFQKEETHV
jgi:ABC-2 type transport system ATP-binding protein